MGLSRKALIRNIKVTTIYLSIATIFSIAFFVTTQNTTNVAIIYMLAVMMIARQTEGYVPGIAASFLGVGFINFIFTYPYMELNFWLAGYPLTFLGMIIISAITSTLTTHLKVQTHISNERERMLMEAEKEKMRANLLRAISHDLRTPLTGIIGTSTTYLEHGDTMNEDAKKNLVKNIYEDANWLLHMVENLLSVTRIQGDGANVITSLEPLEEVVPETVRHFRKRFPEALVRVSIPDEFILVPMDATLIEQVIINLLENAVYHASSPEPIDLVVTMINGSVKFSIRDYGQGIREEHLETLFDGYSPGLNESSDSHKGMGIGLSICKTIINAHHGDIHAANHTNGAEFIFTLPVGDNNYES